MTAPEPHDWRDHSSSPHHHDGDDPEPVWDAARVAAPSDGLRELRTLSDAATPGPWIRRWASLDVHHMGGDDALQAQADIDFAVAATAYVRLMQDAFDALPNLAARVAAPSDGLREALSTPPPEWLDEYSGAKGWEEAMLLVEAALATTGQPETIR
jgi:hypothetical protein